MIIRKLFKFEGGHIVRDCSSDRCKKSIHGHSYIAEVKFEATDIDNGQMVLDFGLTKKYIGQIIDSFDHAYAFWNKETNEFQEFMKSQSERWIKMPVSPSAEMFSLMFFAIIKRIIEKTQFNNGEKDVRLHSVIVHETVTGYAESFQCDYANIWVENGWSLNQIEFSKSIIDEWADIDMWNKILDPSDTKTIINPVIEVKYNK